MGWSYHRKNLRSPLRSIDYITYYDLYGGIYQSQVIDVVEKLNKDFDVEVSLKAFVPIKLWRSQGKLIKSHFPKAKVYPILGRIDSFSRTSILLRKSNRSAICRGPLAYKLARGRYSKMIYDGRAAVRAEVEEYDVAGSKQIGDLLIRAEEIAVTESNACIAVSNQLVNYWNDELNLKFDKDKVVIIPCTLSNYMDDQMSLTEKNDDIKIVYSGGTGPWQSFGLVTDLLGKALKEQQNLKVLFLTKDHEKIGGLVEQFPSRVERKWLNHDEVNRVLYQCDYGMLIRDNSWTNKVASPVKFAEYLNAGLKVLISEELGDYSSEVQEYDLGVIVSDKIPVLEKPVVEEKKRIREYCRQNLTKNAKVISSSYLQLLSLISDE